MEDTAAENNNNETRRMEDGGHNKKQAPRCMTLEEYKEHKSAKSESPTPAEAEVVSDACPLDDDELIGDAETDPYMAWRPQVDPRVLRSALTTAMGNLMVVLVGLDDLPNDTRQQLWTELSDMEAMLSAHIDRMFALAK